jgi:RHS repeat-associated protein
MKPRFLVLFGLITLAAICRAQDDQPANFGEGWYVSGIVAVTNAPSPGNSDPSNPTYPGGSSAIAEAITPEITALAQNLQNNPTLIYNYVHDRIQYAHYFGSHKGAKMTLLEQSGNDFDQCALLVALLRAANLSPTYQFGMIIVPYIATNNQEDYQHWVGATMPNTNWEATLQLAGNINGSSGFPYTTYESYSTNGPVFDLVFHHVWVLLTFNGTNYVLDPSVKVYQQVSGINLDSAAQINTNTLLTDVAVGATATANYVQGLNEGNLRSDLKNCAANLVNYIQTNNPNATVQEIAGGRYIVPSSGQPMPQQALFLVETNEGSWPVSTWQYIPTSLMAVYTVVIPGTTTYSNSFFLPALEGSKLSLVCTSNGMAQLYQEDTQLASVQTTGGSNATFKPTISIQHPYGDGDTWDFSVPGLSPRSNMDDQSSSNALYMRTNANYALLYSLDANAAWLAARQRQLDSYIQQGYSSSSRQVMTETLNVMALNWLVQTELATELLAGQTSMLLRYHHRFGRMAQETGKGYYIDILAEVIGDTPTYTTNNTYAINQALELDSYFQSAFEYGIIEQLQNSNIVGASTIKMIELASTNNQKIYLATSTNWTAGADVSAQISYYNNSSLYSTYISRGYSLLLPQDGSNEIAGAGSWYGSGYINFQFSNGMVSIGMPLAGGYSGGASSTTQPPSPPVVEAIGDNQPTFFNPQSPTLSVPVQFGADPVNMADGSFQITSADLSLGGVEPRGLNLTRYYSSARRNSNPAGMAPGWLHSYYCTAFPTSATVDALGGATPQQMAPMLVAIRTALDVHNATQPSPTNWTVTALIAKWGIDQLINNAVSVNLGNATIQFVKQPDGSYTPPANCTMSLLKTNGSYWLQERHGRTFKFGTNTLLTNIVDQYGQSMKLSYNSNNLVTNVTDWTNRSLAFTYTGGVLTSVADSTGRSVSYGYTNGDLTSYTDPEQKPTSYAYDTNNELVATFDALGRLVESNYYDGFGHIATQLTQGDTNKTWQIYASGYYTVEVDPAGDQRVFTYDNKSRLVAYQDGMGNVTQTVYDGQDHVIETISPLGETTQFIYDGNNNLVETIDPLGFSNTYVFDSNNNLITSIDKRGLPSHFGYNAHFSLTGVTNGNGDWTVFVFNPNGTLYSRQDSAGTTTYAYDTHGALASISYPSPLGGESFQNNAYGDPITHTDGNGNTTTFAYNNRRQLTNTIAPTNVTTKITYDPNGNLSTTTDARFNVTSNTWSVTRHLLTTTFPPTPQGTPTNINTYDTRDWLAETQNPLGKLAYFTNDAAHRLIATTDPLQRPTFLSYDNDGHQTNLTDAASEKTARFWDARGSLVKVIDAANNIVGRAYDGAGNLIFLTNRNTNVWQFQYDGASRLTNTISPLGYKAIQGYNNRGLLAASTNAMTNTTSFTYDARARMTGKTDNLGTVNYVYDYNNLTLLTNVGAGVKLSWVYDAYNRVTSFTNAAGFIVQYRYDNNGNLTNLVYPGGGNRTVKYYYDSNNRLTNVTDWAGRQTSYFHDLAGHLTSVTRPNNTLRAMGYDDDGELTNIVEQTTTQFPIAFYTLHYNLAGRADWEFKGPLPHTNNPPPTRNMTIDSDNRLKTFNGNNVTVDADGNMTYGPLTNNTFGTYTYDARNELTSAGGLSYGYDPAGNRTTMTNGATNTMFVINPQGSQMLMRIKNGTTNYYIYGAGLLYEIDETATATNTAYYHFDCRGSTVALTDGNGNPTDLIEYSPYGMTTFRYGTNDTPFLYNGRYGVQTDPNGLLYMRARYYNPYISRFLNPDPSGFAGGLNFYAFADGNPVSETDPFGLGTGTQNAPPPLSITFNANVNVYPQQYFLNPGEQPPPQLTPYYEPSLPTTVTVQNLSDSDTARQLFQVGVIAAVMTAQTVLGNYLGDYLLLDEATIAAEETTIAEENYVTFFHQGELQNGVVSGTRSLSTSTSSDLMHYNPGGQLYQFNVPQSTLMQWQQQGYILNIQDLHFPSGIITPETRFLPPVSGQLNQFLVNP